MKLVYDIADKPPIKKNLIYAFQQLLDLLWAKVVQQVVIII